MSKTDQTDDTSLGDALEQTFPASDPISMQQAVIAGGWNLSRRPEDIKADERSPAPPVQER